MAQPSPRRTLNTASDFGTVAGVETLAGLRRQERTIATVRWVGVVFALIQLSAYQAPSPALVDAAATARGWAYALVAALAAVGIAIEVVLRTARDTRVLQRVGTAALVADVAVCLGLVVAFAFDPLSSQWALLTIPPLEGALRFGLTGAWAVWGATVPGYLLRDLLAVTVHDRPVQLGATTYRLGLVLIVALFAGTTVAELQRQRRALALVNRAGRTLAGGLDTSEILQVLCREAAVLAEADAALVYVGSDDGFEPVAAWPTEVLPDAVERAATRDTDERARQMLLTVPTWIDAKDGWPAQLAVPMRRPGERTAGLLVVRDPRVWHDHTVAEAMTALAETGAVALATTRVLAAEQASVRRLESLEALRTRFVATVAHDLRLPLTVFKGVAQLLRTSRDRVAPEQVDEMLARVERQANRLSRLADDLLDAARLDADRLQLRVGDVDLGDLVNTCVSDLEEQEVAVRCEGDLRLRGDGPRLERILWNLLSNSEKYGRPPLEVTAWRDGESVRLAVRDHGKGLDEAQRGRLFQDFATGDDGAGVGLGLAIVRRLVVAHDGAVTYTDAQPGACFEVVLPVAGPAGDA